MKSVIVLLAVGVVGAASAQTPDKPPAQPREKPFVFVIPKDFQAPKDKDGKPFVWQAPKDFAGLLDKRDFVLKSDGGTGPRKAPPGQVCLLQVGDDRCPQRAEAIRKPYQPGDSDLYLLDQESGKEKTVFKTVPLDGKQSDGAIKLKTRPKTPD